MDISCARQGIAASSMVVLDVRGMLPRVKNVMDDFFSADPVFQPAQKTNWPDPLIVLASRSMMDRSGANGRSKVCLLMTSRSDG